MSLQFYIQDVHVALFYAMKANGDKGCQAPEMIKVALQVSQLLHYIPSHSCNLNMQKISNVAYHIMRHMRTNDVWCHLRQTWCDTARRTIEYYYPG